MSRVPNAYTIPFSNSRRRAAGFACAWVKMNLIAGVMSRVLSRFTKVVTGSIKTGLLNLSAPVLRSRRMDLLIKTVGSPALIHRVGGICIVYCIVNIRFPVATDRRVNGIGVALSMTGVPTIPKTCILMQTEICLENHHRV